ncbi:MAG: DUF2213 domain-containing protein [Clostridia bacterium]|nr:DUF2213 domain-containing protein [Clostridia bacterium]
MKKLNTDSKTVNNAIITLGDTDDSGKGRHFKSRFIQPGLAGYPGQYGNALIRKENLDKFVHTLRNKPVIINHKDKINDDDKVGEVLNVWFNPDDGWYWCDGVITDETAQNLIQNKKWSVSCSYDFTKYDDEGGTENNIPYDIEFLDGEFAHLAIVDNPRYERANIVFNSKTEFVTVGEGDDKRAVPLDQILPTIKDYKEPQKDYELPKIPDDFIKKLNKTQKPLVLKKNIIEKNKNNHKDIPLDKYNEILSKGIYKADLMFKNKPIDEYFNFVHYGDNKHEHVLIELSENKDNFEIVNFHWLNDKSLEEKLKNATKRVDNEGGQVLIDSEINSQVGDLSNLEIDSIIILNDKLNNFNPKERQDMNVENDKTDNSKEQDMALIEELKKLITKVENDKGDNMINNEKEDKRKLIDEVGGILKGKVDDEIIRTIIKKMEEASYNESEAGSADNKKVKNEADEDKKEDEKVENKKVKNEDEEEKEEDKKEVKELKEDEKKDVENKCNNAKETFFDKMNKIYNSSVAQPKQESYSSRADRLKAGEDYFKV